MIETRLLAISVSMLVRRHFLLQEERRSIMKKNKKIMEAMEVEQTREVTKFIKKLSDIAEKYGVEKDKYITQCCKAIVEVTER